MEAPRLAPDLQHQVQELVLAMEEGVAAVFASHGLEVSEVETDLAVEFQVPHHGGEGCS